MRTIGVIAGDGVGPEVVREGLLLLDELAKRGGPKFQTKPFDLGADRFLRTGEVLPDAEMEALRGCDAIFLGAVGRPDVPPGVLEKGLLLKLRFAFRQCVNLRPVQLFPGVDTPIKGKGPEQIDCIVVRENNEDLYVGTGGFTHKDTPDEVAIQTSVNTRGGVDRCLRYAFELAKARAGKRTFAGLSEADRKAGKRSKLTLVAKTNVLTFAHDLWNRAFQAMAAEYPEVKTDYLHVDAAAMKMVQAPEFFDVMVTTNMFGDILTDLGAILQGGIGLAASGNLNPDRSAPSMFEPVHGSAPDIAGQDKANPLAAFLSLGLMLDHLGENASGDLVRAAVQKVLAAGTPRTPDLGGTAKTQEVGAAVRAALASL